MTKLMMAVFSEREWLRRFVVAGMLFSLGVMQGCAHKEEAVLLSPRVKALMEEFPAGMIDSVEKADEVLDAVNYENKMLDYQFGLDMDACTQKFLVNSCYDEVQLRLRKDRAVLRPMSVEADRFKRSNKVRLRDEALVDAELKELGKAQQREASSRRYEEKEARYLQEQASPGADEASPPRVEGGAYTVGASSKLKNPDTALTPEQRAKNVQEYEDKQLEAERKQEDVQRRMAETQAKRDKRADDAGKEVKRRQKEARD